MQKALVRGGHGWTVLPAIGVADDVAAGTLCAAPLHKPGVWRSIVLGTPRTERVTAAVETVARELVHQVRQAVHSGRWPSARPQSGNR